MNFFITPIILLTSLFCYAQTNFTRLECHGPVPEAVKTTLLANFTKEVESNETLYNDNKNYRKAKEQMLLNSSLSNLELIKSGNVLYGDSVTNYLNSIVDVLLKDDPILRKKIKVFTWKSSMVNAFCTPEGYVFVTIGLIARAENEAQIAFILAHEISHYVEKHIINSIVSEIDAAKITKKRKTLTITDVIKLKCKRSQSHELEADSAGYVLFTKAGYDYSEAKNALTMLGLSHLPALQAKFNPKFLNNNYLKIPSCFFLDEVNPVTGHFDDNDMFHSHPNVKSRKNKIAHLASTTPVGTKKNTLSNKYFTAIKKLALFELVNDLIQDRAYSEALYISYCLQLKFPDSKFLKIAVGKSLYGLAKYKNHNALYAVALSYKDTEGEIQQMYYMFKHLRGRQLNSLALAYLQGLVTTYPKNIMLKKMREDLAIELVVEHELTYKDFFSEEMAKEQLKAFSKIDLTLSKKDQRRYFKNFHLCAIAQYKNDKELKAAFEKGNKKLAKKILKDQLTYKEVQKKKKEKEKKRKNEGYGIKADNIVFIDPDYSIQKKKLAKKALKIDEGERVLNDGIKAVITQITTKNLVLLSTGEMTKKTSEYFNAYSLANNWLEERYNHLRKVHILPLCSDKIYNNPKTSKYKYLCYVDVYNSNYSSYYTFLLLELKTGKLKYSEYNTTGGKYSPEEALNMFKKDLNNVLF